MQKQVLFCATVDYHFSSFHLPYMKWFKDQGWEVHVAASGNLDLPFCDKKFNLPIERSPFKKNNLKAYRELTEILDLHQYQIIHCHTPMGGVLARLAARKARKRGTKVIYTAHGFHFCKGSPITNWLLYYPIEKALANYTDCLITINSEDYQLANKKRFNAKKIVHIHGVGVDTEKFKPIRVEEKEKIREKYGYQKEDFLLFYAAEFNKNKNQRFLLESFALIKDKVPNARLLLAGKGLLQGDCKQLAKEMKINEMVDFLGFRKDIDSLLKISDVAVASSLREGLPVNIMEAMSCGLPVIGTYNRGHRELIENNKTGWIVGNTSVMDFASKLILLGNEKELVKKLGENGRKSIMTKYSTNKVLEEKSLVYSSYMVEMEDGKWAVH